MYDGEKNNDYGKINYDSDFDYSKFYGTDDGEKSSTNNQTPFISDIAAILRDNKTNSHYQCLKCFFFPYIQIKNKNEINYICKCTGTKGKIIKIKDLINQITNFEDKKNKNIENNKLICTKHNHKFRYYCIVCHINIP